MQRVTYYFYGKKKQYLFTLRSLYLYAMKRNKIGPLKLHPINFLAEIWAIARSVENNSLQK